MTYLEMQLATEIATIQDIARYYHLHLRSQGNKFFLTATYRSKIVIDISGDFINVLRKAEEDFCRLTEVMCLGADGKVYDCGFDHTLSIAKRVEMIMETFCSNGLWISGQFSSLSQSNLVRF